ncbi:MAG: helix-turn-helix domain-containing protein [Dehalococcoidia bacterium]|nr:helix-turn-helix domain-containing protein [Dehalococcoidia bacterium]
MTIEVRSRAPGQPRADALPEYQEYRDEGCDLFPSCLACPLVRCRYDVPGGVRALLNDDRNRRMRLARHEDGLSVDDIARTFRVSRRTVFRVLSPAPGGASREESR